MINNAKEATTTTRKEDCLDGSYQPTEAELDRLSQVLEVISSRLGRNVAPEVRDVTFTHLNELILMIDDAFGDTKIITSDWTGRKIVTSIFPNVGVSNGDKGTMVIAREFDDFPPYQEIIDFAESVQNVLARNSEELFGEAA
jgi:hypothetical protein